MTPLTNYTDLKTWYIDFKLRIGKATKPDIKFVDKIDEQIAKKAKNVYGADYKFIDDTIEDIKKESRKVSTSDYAANNVYLFLQDCLKKIILAER